MSKVLIRQIPDDYAVSTGLSKYNRSRMPGTRDVLVASEDGGRYITGLDEEAVKDSVESEKIKELRLQLEEKTKKDLSATSDFWTTFAVLIESDKPKTFNTERPMDLIALKMLYANHFVAPSFEESSNPVYKNSNYYAYTEESEAKKEMSNRKQGDLAIAKLSEIAEDKDRLLLFGQYLEGAKYISTFGVDTLYKMLRAYIEDVKSPDNVKHFLNAFDADVEEIQRKIIIDNALRKNLIKKVNVGGKKHVYQYGQVTVGANVQDVYKNLALVDYAPELAAIQKALEE